MLSLDMSFNTNDAYTLFRYGVCSLVVLALGFGLLFFVRSQPAQSDTPTTDTEASEEVTHLIAPPSPAVVERLKKSTGFKYLVSYTGTNFEPSELMVENGDVIRFTNNTDEELVIRQLDSSGSPIQKHSVQCVEEVFETCIRLAPNDFFEYAPKMDSSDEIFLYANDDLTNKASIRAHE